VNYRTRFVLVDHLRQRRHIGDVAGDTNVMI
jgi:hypothetical protein